jgi:hypothetical protein
VTMKKVMEFAHQCCFTHVILKSNCQMLIRILDRKEHNLTYFGKIVNIQSMTRMFSTCSFGHRKLLF